MKNIITILVILIAIALAGCDLIESQLTNIDGWNLSACYDGFSTCWQLFSDNQTKILGGQAAIDAALSAP